MALHASTVRPNLFRRLAASRKGRIVLVLSALMLAGAVTAFAVYFALAKVQGGGQSGTFTVQWMNATKDAATTTVTNVGSPTVSNGTANLPSGLVMFPGDTFTIAGAVQGGNGSAAGYVSGVQLPGLPAGYEAKLIAGCGAAVSDMSQAQVKVQIKMLDTANPDGKPWTLGSGAGVQAFPASQGGAPTTCATYTGQ